MNEQARQRAVGHTIEAALTDQAGAERYRRTQWEARHGGPAALDRPRPLEFDESGFPVAQRNPSLVTRVARLLSPG